MKQIVLKLFLFSLPLLQSCARESSAPIGQPTTTSNQANPLVKVENVNSYQTALNIVNSTALSCAQTDSCPAFVGMFLAADKPGGFSAGSDSVAACTAVLIGEDLALTNSHCIPSAVKLLPDLCSERIKIVFPATETLPEESLTCSALIGHSERLTPMSPDLALLRLEKKTSRPFPTLNRSGVFNNSLLRSLKVNPDLKKLTGLLREEKCVSTSNSYRMPIYQDAKSPALVFGDCSAVPGNSGGALIDQNGNLVGLMQADLPISENARREWTPFLNSESGFAQLAMGTSLVCLEANPPNWQWNPRCTTVTEQDVAIARPRIREILGSEELESQASQLLAPYLSQTSLLRWQRSPVETRPLRRREALQPLCLAPAEAWVANFTHAPEGDSLLESAELLLEIPRISFELRFNRYLQPMPAKAILGEIEKHTYIFSPRAAAETGKLELNSKKENGESLRLSSCE